MNPRSCLAAILVTFACVGCGPPTNLRVVRPAEMRDPAMFNQPVWVAFEAGDELPVYIDVEGPLFVLKPREPVSLRVKKKCFLLIGDGPPRLSFDKQTFLDGGGSFAFGIGNSVERGPHISVTVRHAAGAGSAADAATAPTSAPPPHTSAPPHTSGPPASPPDTSAPPVDAPP